MDQNKERPTPRPTNQVIFSHSKSNDFDSQLERVYQSFYESPKTMKEVDKSIGIMRESICWFCRTLRKQDKLFPIRKRLCNVTRHPATEWTSNPALMPIRPEQLTLFGKEPAK